MLIPYSNVELPSYSRPDRFTRKFNYVIGNLINSLTTKLGLEEKEYRDVYENKEKEIFLAENKLTSYTNQEETDFFSIIKYGLIISSIIFLLFYLKKKRKI